MGHHREAQRGPNVVRIPASGRDNRSRPRAGSKLEKGIGSTMRSRIIKALVRAAAQTFGRRMTPDQVALALVIASLYDVSTGLSDDLNDAIFNATAYSETTAYVSLHTADPGATGASECTGGSYARQAAPAVASSSGTYTSNANIDFTSMPACTVTHAGIWDAATVGNFLLGGALAASKVVGAGDTFRIASGDLTCAWS
jgi:hypothetical protein